MRDELLKLAERCEAAAGADRELDATIAAVVRLERVPGWARSWSGEWRPTDQGSVVLMEADGTPGPHFMAREYSASLDAAMTLVPEGFKVREFEQDSCHEWSWWCWLTSNSAEGSGQNFSAPLALCAAALRARARSEAQ